MYFHERNVLCRGLSELIAAGRRVTVGIDGSCGAGKSTLGEQLGRELDCPVFHMDDFFLRPEQRSAERLSAPGGNVDYERFRSEVLEPVSRGMPVMYRRFDCRTGKILPPVTIAPSRANIVEGSYSLHPALRRYYDLTVFMSASSEAQLRRITERNGPAAAAVFKDRWIPLENRYFEAYNIMKDCDFVFRT